MIINTAFFSRNLIKITIAVSAAAIVLVNAFIPEPEYRTTAERIQADIVSGNYIHAEAGYLELLAIDSTNIDLHYGYIVNHFRIPNGEEIRDDDKIRNYYFKKTQNSNKRYKPFSNSIQDDRDIISAQMADIGNYGIGLIESVCDRYPSAVHEFAKVKNRELKYLSNSMGFALMYCNPNEVKKSDLVQDHPSFEYAGNDSYDVFTNDSTQLTRAILDSLSEIYFLNEISLKGYVAGAYPNLARFYWDIGDDDGIYRILSSEEGESYVPVGMARKLFFIDAKIFSYLKSLVDNYNGINFWGFLAAFLIMISWIVFLRKVDVYETEKWKLTIAAVIMGMLGSVLVFPFSDFLNMVADFTLNGEIINDFLYSFIAIGMVEEFVKILPLLILLKYTKAVNEPFDYILYASLSALGFAFAENLLYFTEQNLEIIHGRALIAVVSHMFDSALIGYGLMLNRYKRHYNPYVNLIFFFLLASFSHGFYDFWLVNDAVHSLSFISLILAFVQIQLFNIFMNNSLNHSVFFDKNKSLDNELMRGYLISSLAAVLILEYVALAFRWSPDQANDELFSSIAGGTWIILFISRTLSQFKLTKGIWAPVSPYISSNDRDDFKLEEGLSVNLDRLTCNELTNDYLPNYGKLSSKLTVSGEPFWYLVQLELPADHSEDCIPENEIRIGKSGLVETYLKDKVIIRIKDPRSAISMTTTNYFGIYLIPEGLNLERQDLERMDLIFCGWTVLRLRDEMVMA